MGGCTCGKVGYASEKEARHTIRRVEKKTGQHRHKVYACPDVPKLWHLTVEGKRR